MKIIKTICIIVAGVALLFLLFLAFFTITEFKPDDITALNSRDNSAITNRPGGLQLLSWNIGYCGLDSESDFFMEGGSQKKRNSIDRQRDSLDGIIEFIDERDPDVCFLQEVDTKSRRSYKIDQQWSLSSYFDNRESFYGKNYSCLFVPVPVQAPIGKVQSGVMTMSRFKAEHAERHSLPGSYDWPVKIFHLKRCAVVTQFPSAVEGRDWYLINLHLSAYGDGSLRSLQLDYIKSFMMEKYNEGHYVVAGGDWNSLFPGVDKDQFGTYTTDKEYLFWLQTITTGWTPENWQWCYDRTIPTCRSLEQPFKDGENFTTIIDGFLVSPNLKVDYVKGWDLKFKYTDHNPVSVTVSIRD